MRRRKSPVSPSTGEPTHDLYPVEGGPGVQQSDEQEGKADGNQEAEIEVIDTDTRPVWEKMGMAIEEYKGKELEDIADKYEDLKTKLEQYFDDANCRNPNKVPVVGAPVKPTRNEWLQHQATHTPFAPWCRHCVAARAVRHAHPSKGRRTVMIRDTENAGDKPAKVSIDYMYLHERSGQGKGCNYNPPQLVMVDHGTGRVWAYRVPNKGILEGAAWLPRRISQDLDNCGYKDIRLQLKSDQDPAIVNLQTAIQEIRPNTVPTNSPVGESESNGRAENAIRRIQEKTRTLRHQLENGIQQKVPDDSPIMSWLIRWAGELISKYAMGDDGKIAYERIRGERCAVPIVPFGEAVMYLPLRTAKHSKGEAAKKIGIWLGTLERTEETLIGIVNGVIKCRTVNRLAEDERWNSKLTLGMRGVPWEPVQGKTGQHIPVEIGADGRIMDEAEENVLPEKYDDDEGEQELEYSNKTHNLHVSQKAISKYGTTEGCPACNVINKRGHFQGRVGYNHSMACRTRIKAEMQQDPEYRRLMYKHEVQQEAGNIEILTEAQVMEKRHNVMKAIATIEKNIRETTLNMERQLTQTMFKHLIAKMEVAEVYSPSSVTDMARQMGLRAGWALDISTHDVDGREWDFNQLEMRNRAIRKILQDKPILLVGSPMCTAFSALNNINYCKMHPEEIRS